MIFVETIRRTQMKLYGWEEFNEASFGLQVRTEQNPVPVDWNPGEFLIDGSADGRWFSTFRQAKNELLKEIFQDIKTLKSIEKKIRKIQKKDIGEPK